MVAFYDGTIYKHITKFIQKIIARKPKNSLYVVFSKVFFPYSVNVNLGQRPKLHLLMKLKLLNVNIFPKRSP